MGQSGALDGIRVVDLTTVLMGPLATRMLGDHGADVIQVVSPATAMSAKGDRADMSAITLDLHRNKRSMALDLKSEAGKQALWDLIAASDVLVSNMRAAALSRLGFSAAEVRSRHPELIYCLANGYGEDGPYANRAAYDDAIQAISGFAALSSRISGEPVYAPSIIVDKVCGLYIVQAVLAAIIHRQKTNQGQTIRVPMFEIMASFNLVEHFRDAALVPPKGKMGYTRILNPERRPFRSRDGWIAILPYTESNWRDFFNIIGMPEVMDDTRFATHASRMKNAEFLYRIIRESAGSKTTQEWIELCDRYSIPCNPVLDIEDLPNDPHLNAVDLLSTVNHPTEGKYQSVRDPVSYDTLSTGLRRHAPVPGQDTAEIMSELGWSDEEIERLGEDHVKA